MRQFPLIYEISTTVLSFFLDAFPKNAVSKDMKVIEKMRRANLEVYPLYCFLSVWAGFGKRITHFSAFENVYSSSLLPKSQILQCLQSKSAGGR